MPPLVAALLTAMIVFGLFARDYRHRDGETSGALWLPVLWLSIIGSRFVSQWLLLGQAGATSNVTEGSPVDATVFLCLMVLGAGVLAKRHFSPVVFVRRNFWVFAFFFFGLLSIVWSDFSFIAFKRWVKTLGHPIMALVILTDPDPQRALRIVLKRVGYLLVPLSVLFIKYFPQFGRGWDPWTGQAFNNGVGLTKNDLGYVCWVLGVFFFWNFFQSLKLASASDRRWEMALSAGFIAAILWLLQMANSATSVACLVIGLITLGLGGSRLGRHRFLGTLVLLGVLVAVALDASFHVYERVVSALGRDPSLTDRTEVWADAIRLQPHPFVGAGFESFWLGTRLETLWAKWWWRPGQAHNGYIETYLNLGLIGLSILVALIVSTFFKIKRGLTVEPAFALLQLAFFFAILAFNYTEAAFKALHFVWTIFFIVAIDYGPSLATESLPERRADRAARSGRAVRGRTRGGAAG